MDENKTELAQHRLLIDCCHNKIVHHFDVFIHSNNRFEQQQKKREIHCNSIFCYKKSA